MFSLSTLFIWLKTHFLAVFASEKATELVADKTFDVLLSSVTDKVRDGRERRAVKRVYKNTMREFASDPTIYDKDAKYCFARFNYVKTHPSKQEMMFAAYPELGTFMRRFYDNLKSNDETLKIIGQYAIPGIYEFAADTNKMMYNLLENSVPNAGAALKDNIATMWEAIDGLKLKTAVKILDKMEKSLLQYPELQKQKAVYATLYFLKGYALEYLNPQKAAENYKRAYDYNPHLPHLKEHYLLTLFLNDKIDDNAEQLVDDILRDEESNYVANAVSALEISSDVVSALHALDNSIKKDYRFKWLVMQWLNRHDDRILEVEKDVPMTYGQLPEKLNADNFLKWLYILNAIINQFVRSDDVDIFGNMHGHPEHREQLEAISKFYELADKTELRNPIVSVRALFDYLQFLKTRDEEWLTKVLEIREDDEVCERCKFYALMFHDEYEKAYDILSDKYQPFCARHKMYAALKMADIVRVKASIEYLVGHCHLVKLNIVTIFECIKQHRALLENKIFVDALRVAKYEPNASDAILPLYLDAIEGHKENERLEDLLQKVDDGNYAIACRLWADAADAEFAYEKMQGKYNPEETQLETLLYLDLLFSCNTHNEEFCKLNKSLRDRHHFFMVPYLQKEVNCYSSILDFDSAREPQEILFNLFPDYELFTGNYAMMLVKTKNVEKINEHAKDFVSIHYTNTNCIKNVFYALQEAKEYEAALEFIYPYAKDENFAEIGDFYIKISMLDAELGKLLHEVMPSVEEGYTVQLTSGKENIITEAHEKSERTTALIGHKVGDKVTYNDKEYTITNIGDKYLALVFELKDRMGRKGNIYLTQTLALESDDKGEDLLKKLEIMLPKTEAKYTKESFEDDVRAFERGEHSLYLFMTNDMVFSAIQIILSDFRKIVFPYDRFSASLDDYKKQKIEITDFVLDPFSVVLLAYLSKELGYTYSRKFLIPKSEKDAFALSLSNYKRYPNNINPINFRGVIPQNIDTSLGEEYSEVLKYLNEWIENNCKVEFVNERMAQPEGSHLQMVSLEILADCLMLAKRPLNMLITEDTAVHSLFNELPFPAICGETFLRYFENCGIELEKALLGRNYVVSILDTDTIFVEYEKSCSGQPNRYDTCKIVMSLHLEMWQKVMELIAKILTKEILTSMDIVEVKSHLCRLIKLLGAKRQLLLSNFINHHPLEVKLQQKFAQIFKETCWMVDGGREVTE